MLWPWSRLLTESLGQQAVCRSSDNDEGNLLFKARLRFGAGYSVFLPLLQRMNTSCMVLNSVTMPLAIGVIVQRDTL